ncbi:hypothetical protein [Chryseobacterium wanjuense]
MSDGLDLGRLPTTITIPPTNEDFQRAEKDEEELTKDIKNAELQRYLKDTRDRGWLAKWTACVVSIWLFLVITILYFNKNYFCLFLSDTVLVALLGTTTLNVLGLSFIVLKGHFNSANKGNSSPPTENE